MRYTPVIYAKAFWEAIKDKKGEERDFVIKRFSQVISKNGDWASVNKIVGAIERVMVKARGGRWVRMEFARPMDQEVYDKMEKVFHKNDHIKRVINPRLVAGSRIIIDGEREFDGSFARKLKKMFG